MRVTWCNLRCCACTDGAVLSGLLTWARLTGVSRTSVQFTLTLSLDHVYYGDVSVGDTIPLPGLLLYGDNSQVDEGAMMEVMNITNYTVTLNYMTDYCTWCFY